MSCGLLKKSIITVFNDLHQTLEMWQDGAAHKDGDLLDNLDAGVTRLPRLLRAANGFQEGQQGGDTCFKRTIVINNSTQSCLNKSLKKLLKRKSIQNQRQLVAYGGAFAQCTAFLHLRS